MNYRNKKRLHMLLITLILVITLGIGYASISAINLIIIGNATASSEQANFKVKFLNESGVTPTIEGTPTNTISVDSDTTASFNISTLDGKGQSVTATYKIKNISSGIGATISLRLTNSNTEYFKVTERILDDTLQAGEETTVTVEVEMLKTPITEAVSTTVTATLVATPIDNTNATGGNPKEEIKPAPLIYTVDGVNDAYINTDISSWTRKFNTFQDAKTAFGYPASLAHDTEDGRITASYVVFERNNQVYYLKGRINESNSADKPVYNQNVRVLKEAFGPNWESVCTDSSTDFICSTGGLMGNVSTSGAAAYRITNNSWYCHIFAAGGARCYNG